MNNRTCKWIRRDLQHFKPYQAHVKPHVHKLDANESPFPMPPEVKARIIAWFEQNESLNIYPDTDSTRLREALALFWHVAPENILCSVGLDQMIDYITKVFLEEGDGILTLSPTFAMYGITTIINHGQVYELPLTDGQLPTVAQIVAEVQAKKPKLLFLCTPNNPTGHTMSKADIMALLPQVDIPVVVDEAYCEYNHPDETLIPEINGFDNLIVLRTFSKAYGLAGARIGYAIANDSLIHAINLVKAPYNLPVLSQVLALEVLANSDTFKERVATIITQREMMLEALKKYDWLKISPSGANFIFLNSSRPVADKLEAAGILVRCFEKEKIEKIRITIGLEEQNRAVLEVFEQCHHSAQ